MFRLVMIGWLLSIVCHGAVALAQTNGPKPATAPQETMSAPTGSLSSLGVSTDALNALGSGSNAKFLTIHTGSTTGVYYFVGSSICKTLFGVYRERDLHCAPIRSRGTADNISALSKNEAQMAIIQPELSNFPGGSKPITNTFSVMSLHSEGAVMVIAPGTEIHSLADLKGKIVDLGKTEGSTIDKLLGTVDLTRNDFRSVTLSSFESKAHAVCDHDIDAFVMWIGHPASGISRLVDKCGATVVGLWTPQAPDVLRTTPHLFRQEIPGNTYVGHTDPILTIGPRAILVARESVDPDVVYAVTKSVFEGLDGFRSLHPALRTLAADVMVQQGNFLPFHPGALRYYKERGWIPDQPPEQP